MPRKYQDNQLVAVRYGTRRMYALFLGVVQKYDSGKYYVRYVSGEKSFPHDKVFECHTKELCDPSNSFIDDMQESQVMVYNNIVRSRADRLPHYHGRSYYDNDERLIWSSFAAKRILGSHFHRTFPVAQMVWRTDYVC